MAMGTGMYFRVIAVIIVVPLFAYQVQAQDTQSKIPQAKTQPTQQAEAAQTQPPSFRKGLWRFIRTLDVVRNSNKNVKYRVVNREMTRCVDPTYAMKATFSPAPIGSCVSDKPEKVGNKYTFGHRCDYMGAVSTVITVHSDESYTEVNEVSAGDNPKTDLVTAKRIGDCNDDKADESARSRAAAMQH
jgi:hypothetical protein